jgi:hypothetical protein
LFLDLGHVNQAEKCFCEALETCGDMPATLQYLALINIVKNRPETARIFLGALARHPLQRHAAQAMRARLETDPTLSTDPRVARIRDNMVERDFVELDTPVEAFLLALLDKNPRNRMALDLLLAHYLTIGRPDGVVATLPRLRAQGHSRIPRHYQETVAIDTRSRGVHPALAGFELDAETLRQAEQFANIVSRAPDQAGAMQAAQAAGLGDTYFFYLAFGMSGL